MILRTSSPTHGSTPLILLDELPPYLDNAKSISVGNSDLAKVMASALTNLFEAVAENELSNVCVVLTDVVGTYAEASAQIARPTDLRYSEMLIGASKCRRRQRCCSS